MAYGPKPNGAAMRARARAFYHNGLSFAEIARQLQVGPETVHRWVDPAYDVHRRLLINYRRRIRIANGATG